MTQVAAVVVEDTLQRDLDALVLGGGAVVRHLEVWGCLGGLGLAIDFRLITGCVSRCGHKLFPAREQLRQVGAAVGIALVVLHILAHAPQLGGPLGRRGVAAAVALVPLDQVLGRVHKLVFSPADLSGIDGQLNGDPVESALALVAQDTVDNSEVALQYLG